MKSFREYLESKDSDFILSEARDKSVPTEFRIALGQLKRMYNPNETPKLDELVKDAEIVAKKAKIDIKKFIEYAKEQYNLNEAKLTKSEYKDKKQELIDLLWTYDKGEGFNKKEDIYKQYKMEIDTIMLGKVKIERALDLLGFSDKYKNDKDAMKIVDFLKDNLNEAKSKEDLVKYYEKNLKNVEKEYSTDSRKQEYIDYAKGQLAAVKKDGVNGLIKFLKDWNLNEAAVGQRGRTSYKEAQEYCEENEELVDEFRKIIKKLGGKTVAKALLDKLSQKSEIKDEIEHISNIVMDNSNY